MKWFAILVFATTYAGDKSVVPVETEAECRELIKAVAQGERRPARFMMNSRCVSIDAHRQWNNGDG